MPRLFQSGEPAAEEEALAEAYHSPTRHSTVRRTTLQGPVNESPDSGARELACHWLALTCFSLPFRGVSQPDLDGRNVSGAPFLRFQLLRA